MIHEIYYQQALKPKGNNVNEKLDFVASWYSKTSSAITPSDKHQENLCKLMAEWSSYMLLNLKKDNNEDTKTAIQNYIPTIEEKLSAGSLTTAEKAFYSYFFIELERTLQ